MLHGFSVRRQHTYDRSDLLQSPLILYEPPKKKTERRKKMDCGGGGGESKGPQLYVGEITHRELVNKRSVRQRGRIFRTQAAPWNDIERIVRSNVHEYSSEL